MNAIEGGEAGAETVSASAFSEAAWDKENYEF
jgi:hypothetical protein